MAKKSKTEESKTGDYLQSLTFKEDYRCFKKRNKITFRPGLNLLVGDNGSGKSTIFELLRNLAEGKSAPIDLKRNPCQVRSLDFEKESPRTGNLSWKNPVVHFVTKSISHGECVQKILEDSSVECKNVVLMMDEPDMALSIRSIVKLQGWLDKMVQNGCQVIAAVHNPILIASNDVLDLETRKWVRGQDFIDMNKEENS